MALTRLPVSFLVISSLLVIASATGYGHGSAGYVPKLDKLFPIDKLIGIEGFIFCKSGPKHFPLEGAKARIRCVAEDVNGYESIFSTLSCPTDVKGYFFASISSSSLLQDNIKKLSNCKTILEESPLETCNIPTDINKGISGYSLDSFRFLHDKNINLFSVPSLFYTCQGPTTDVEKEKFLPKKSEYEKEEEHVPPTKPDYEVKPVYKDTEKPQGKDKKPGYGSEPKPDDEKQKYVPNKPYYEEPKPAQGNDHKLIDHLPTNFDVQGLVLCKSGAHYFPLQGAVANISCVAVDEEGKKIRKVFSKLSGASDEKGYFFVNVCGLNDDLDKLVIKECNVCIDRIHSKLLDSTCNIPTDVNKGITGALLDIASNFRILHQKINLYTVGPFFYTTTTTTTTTSQPKPDVPAVPHY